jgi:hypothetical protein
MLFLIDATAPPRQLPLVRIVQEPVARDREVTRTAISARAVSVHLSSGQALAGRDQSPVTR